MRTGQDGTTLFPVVKMHFPPRGGVLLLSGTAAVHSGALASLNVMNITHMTRIDHYKQ